jgi:type III restriction enzyme
LTFKESKSEEKDFIKLKDIKPFVWSKQVYPADRCIFNYVPCENNLEVAFSKFLDRAEDVKSFTKIVSKIGFFIEYISQEKILKLYYPDFIVKTDKERYFIIETKGRVDIDVEAKDERARKWCEDATSVTGKEWEYFRIDQEEFERRVYKKLEDLL